MCIGFPMKVVEVLDGGGAALCETRAGAMETIDLSLVGALGAGTWVLAFMGAARSVMDEDEAMLVADALEALAVAADGGNVDHLFSDLIDREPQLPQHLRTKAAE